MNIGITPGKENLIQTGQAEGARTPEQALQTLLQEGKVLSARVLAQSGNNALLKLADLLIPVKTDAHRYQ
jgi:Tfp pilus assembly pilus retraction ATPase PilT